MPDRIDALLDDGRSTMRGGNHYSIAASRDEALRVIRIALNECLQDQQKEWERRA